MTTMSYQPRLMTKAVLVIHSNNHSKMGFLKNHTCGRLLETYVAQKNVSVVDCPRLNFSSRCDWISQKDSIPQNISHFRVKNHDSKLRLQDDIFILKELLAKFYKP